MIHRIEETTSTNDDARDAKYRHGDIVWAERQTAGRGQRGHKWSSAEGLNLTFSLVLEPRFLPAGEQFLLNEAVALALTDTFAQFGIAARIKWTNDIVLGGRKLCGILTELGLEGESNALDYLITGIGVNVNQRTEDFLPEVRPIAVSLAQELGRPVRRAELAVEIIRALDRMYAGFPDNKAEYLARYRADCLTPGNQVQLITPVSREEAFALEIDDQFRLVVEYPDGRRAALSAGEVSVRGMYGYV